MRSRKMILSDTIKPLLGGARIFTLLSVFLLVTLCGCSDSRRHISGIFVNDEGDELIHICPDRDFVMIVPDFDVITGVSELLTDTTLALYYMDGSDTLAVDTFVVRYREDNKCDLIAPRDGMRLKGL